MDGVKQALLRIRYAIYQREVEQKYSGADHLQSNGHHSYWRFLGERAVNLHFPKSFADTAAQ